MSFHEYCFLCIQIRNCIRTTTIWNFQVATDDGATSSEFYRNSSKAMFVRELLNIGVLMNLLLKMCCKTRVFVVLEWTCTIWRRFMWRAFELPCNPYCCQYCGWHNQRFPRSEKSIKTFIAVTYRLSGVVKLCIGNWKSSNLEAWSTINWLCTTQKVEKFLFKSCSKTSYQKIHASIFFRGPKSYLLCFWWLVSQ